jgi:integrase
MESSVYFGTDNYWHGRVTMGIRPDGQSDRRHIQRKDENEVREEVRRLETLRNSGKKAAIGRPWKLKKWLEHWVNNIVKPNQKYKTWEYYETAVRLYLNPKLGAHRIDRLEPEHVETMYTILAEENVGPSVLRQVHNTLRAALNEAVRRQRIDLSPMRVVRSPRMNEEEIEPLTVEEAQRVLAMADTRRNGARFAIALALGLRQGEALGLQWRDLAPSTKTLTVRRALQRQKWRHGCGDPHACGADWHKTRPCERHCTQHKRACPQPCRKDCTAHARHCPERHGGGLVVVATKSRSGRRVLNVPAKVLGSLAEHRLAQQKERDLAGSVWEDGDWIFCQPNGKPLDARRDYQEWQDLLATAGVRPTRLHNARHTAATILLVLRTPKRAVMDVMGWSAESMTKRYQHVPDELREQIAKEVGSLLWGSDSEDGGDEDAD